jgi:hypothetical protein
MRNILSTTSLWLSAIVSEDKLLWMGDIARQLTVVALFTLPAGVAYIFSKAYGGHLGNPHWLA